MICYALRCLDQLLLLPLPGRILHLHANLRNSFLDAYVNLLKEHLRLLLPVDLSGILIHVEDIFEAKLASDQISLEEILRHGLLKKVVLSVFALVVLVAELLLNRFASVEAAFPLATARLLERFGPASARFVPFLVPFVGLILVVEHLRLESPDGREKLLVLLLFAVAFVEANDAGLGKGREPLGDVDFQRSVVNVLALGIRFSLWR